MIILGGGIIGKAIAWQLANAGYNNLMIFEESCAYPPATSVAAGMLAPVTEAHLFHPELLEMGKESLELYPNFLKTLQEETGISLSLTSKGTLLVAEDKDGLDWLKAKYRTIQQVDFSYEWLDSGQVRELEPALNSCVLAAIHLPDERDILVSDLLKALEKALLQRNVSIINKKVKAVEKGWTLHFEEGESITTSQLVIAAGAWLKFLALPEKPKIVPNQGEILSIRGNLNHMIRSRKVYLCPKSDGTVRMGATADYVGHDLNPTAGSVRQILRDGFKLFPALDDAHLLSVHAGLRPFSLTGQPIIEKEKGIYWAVGHGRSGVLLAPFTAKRIEQLIRRDDDYNQLQRGAKSAPKTDAEAVFRGT